MTERWIRFSAGASLEGDIDIHYRLGIMPTLSNQLARLQCLWKERGSYLLLRNIAFWQYKVQSGIYPLIHSAIIQPATTLIPSSFSSKVHLIENESISAVSNTSRENTCKQPNGKGMTPCEPCVAQSPLPIEHPHWHEIKSTI